MLEYLLPNVASSCHRNFTDVLARSIVIAVGGYDQVLAIIYQYTCSCLRLVYKSCCKHANTCASMSIC